MELEIKAIAVAKIVEVAKKAKPKEKKEVKENKAAEKQIQLKIQEQRQKSLVSAKNVDASRYFQEILNFTEIFNKKLKFNIDQDSDQVIVKVVDSTTDKVIKEIPPEELQRLYSSMKEAIGLLIDEQR